MEDFFLLEKDQYDVSSTDSDNVLRRSNSYLVYFSFVYHLEGKERRGKQIWRGRGGEESGKGHGVNRGQREGRGIEGGGA